MGKSIYLSLFAFMLVGHLCAQDFELRPEQALVDTPDVPPTPTAVPEDVIHRLRNAINEGNEDQALGEAYDFIKRYPGHPLMAETNLAAGALHMRRGEAKSALRFLTPLTQDENASIRSRAIHLAGGALTALGQDGDILNIVPTIDPAKSKDRWLILAQVWRAGALDRLGHKDEATQLYRAVASSGQDSPVRAYALAAIAADWDRRGHADRTREALVRASEEAVRWKISGLSDALALAGANALTRARKLDEAAKAYLDFTRAFANSPLIAQAYYERGMALKRLGRESAAIESFEALLDHAPDSAYAADAHLQLGQLQTKLGRTGEALKHYKKMGRTSEAHDADREAVLLMAQVHYNAKRWREAIPLYRDWLNGAPARDAKTKDVQGLLVVSLWQTDPDSEELRELIAKIPDHPLAGQIRWAQASAAYKRGDWATAEESFKHYAQSDPKSPRVVDARYFRAEALRQLDRKEEAVDAYRQVLKYHPQHALANKAAMQIGELLYQAGDAEGAAKAYERVRGKGPEAENAAYNRALALAKAGDPAVAWEKFATHSPLHPKASWAWWTAAREREERKDYAGAAKNYERATGPMEKAKSLYALGRLRERMKQKDLAKAVYLKLKNISPKNDPARLSGLLRLALMLELEEKPKQAAPLYGEIMRQSDRDSATFETARKRLGALTSDSSLLER